MNITEEYRNERTCNREKPKRNAPDQKKKKGPCRYMGKYWNNDAKSSFAMDADGKKGTLRTVRLGVVHRVGPQKIRRKKKKSEKKVPGGELAFTTRGHPAEDGRTNLQDSPHAKYWGLTRHLKRIKSEKKRSA